MVIDSLKCVRQGIGKEDRRIKMNSQIFTQIALMVISIVGALVSAYLIPYIKSKANANDIERFIDFVWLAVRCANQIYTPEQWQDKKLYVLSLVTNFMYENLKISLSDEQVNAIIEGMVNEVKKADSELH